MLLDRLARWQNPEDATGQLLRISGALHAETRLLLRIEPKGKTQTLILPLCLAALDRTSLIVRVPATSTGAA